MKSDMKISQHTDTKERNNIRYGNRENNFNRLRKCKQNSSRYSRYMINRIDANVKANEKLPNVNTII